MTTETKTKADTISTDFPKFLSEIRKGQLVFECAEKMEELVAAIRRENKSGSFNLKIEIGPLNPGNADTLAITAKPTIKAPEPTTPKAVFYSTSKNTLQRKDPRQQEFDGIDD